MKYRLLLAAGLFLVPASLTLGVTSVMTRHRSGSDFLKGEAKNILIDSAGTLRLARQSRPVEVGELLNGAWSIHTLLADASGAIYLGTGPAAKVIRLADGKSEQVYPVLPSDVMAPKEPAGNEHVFALARDVAGRLLVAVSGKAGRLVRLGVEPETVFQDERVQYIFAMALDAENNIYLATGPNGLLIRLDAFAQNPQVLFDAKDHSLLSLAVRDGIVYAGGDQRGLVYRIDPQTGRATVLYDSDQDEIPSLFVDEQGNIYAAATTAGAAMLQLQTQTPALKKTPGRPDTETGSGSAALAEQVTPPSSSEKTEKKDEAAPAQQAPPPPPARAAGHIYKINPEGFVTDVFSEMAVLYSLTQSEGKLWLGTGSKGQLFTVDPLTEEAAVLYEDKTSSQVTAVCHVNGAAYVGLSNPARLVRIGAELAPQGTFESAFLDAGQPARWGKLQIEADIPPASKVLMSCRSGNVNDPNDQTFSPWSPEVELTEAAVLSCPPARFCQYKLTLTASPDGKTPVVREVAAANVVPNLAPRIAAVKAERSRDKKKLYAFDISFAAGDENKDALEYRVEFRKVGNKVWIPLADELEQPRYEWDSRTVEDGRYEARVTASDRKSNTPETTLTGSRISDPFVIDNTAPEVTQSDIAILARGAGGYDALVKLTVQDALSVLGSVQYTVDSNEKWQTALPDDLVYDTLTETFSIRIEKLKPGPHVIAVVVGDDAENTRYKSWEVNVP
ncbi:MAG: hypothetical protein LLF76_14005 [Planctomycetaceae bacterium]|nr:hypothetical protein [Planctomycetaceae bacterium]